MPREFGSGSAIHEYFQEWVERGLFEKLWRIALKEYDELVGIDWLWQGLNGAITKAPLGGEKNRSEPDGSGQTGSQVIYTHGRSRRATKQRRSMAPTSTIKSLSARPSSRCRCVVLDPANTSVNTCVLIRVMAPSQFVGRSNDEVTPFTFHAKGKRQRPSRAAMPRPVAGSWSGPFLDQPRPPTADPLGKESLQLPGDAALPVRSHDVAGRWCSRIGF